MENQAKLELRVGRKLEEKSWQYSTLKSVWFEMNAERVTYDSILKAVKANGMSLKNVVVRDGETSSVKESRIWFYAELAKFIGKSNQRIIFFD